MEQTKVTFTVALPSDTGAILDIAKSYPKDFATYIRPLPSMVRSGRVFVVKRDSIVLGFAAYGLDRDDPHRCMTASARLPKVSREELSGDWIRCRLETELMQRGFRKFTAHVRKDNRNAIKMLRRNGYIPTLNVIDKVLLEFSKEV